MDVKELKNFVTTNYTTTCLLLLRLPRPGVVPPGVDVLTELPQHGSAGPGEAALHHGPLPTSYRLVLLQLHGQAEFGLRNKTGKNNGQWHMVDWGGQLETFVKVVEL